MVRSKLVIFDCDGVVVDSEPIAIGVLHKLLLAYNVNVSYEDCERCFLGKSLQIGLIELKTIDCHSINLLPSNFSNISKQKINLELSKKLLPIKDIHYALDRIPNKKCIASGSDLDRLDISLSVTRTKPHFSEIYSSSMVKRGKPSPDLFLFAAESSSYEIEQCIVIEDSAAGMKAALNAGMKTILYDPGNKSNFFIPSSVIQINSMMELPEIIKEIETEELIVA